MILVNATGVEKAWADRAILRGCDLTVTPGERVGLVGPNGCGKSTFLQILGGLAEQDAGRVQRAGRVAMLTQEPVLDGATIEEAMREAIAWHGDLLARWQTGTETGADVSALHDRLDEVGWDLTHRVDAMLSLVGAPPRDRSTANLSGGERRRVALARALLAEPDVLLLDEPTNHLDTATIEALQGQLLSFHGAVLLVTHDRYLLESVATRIVEIDDGVSVSYDGSYADYLISRAERQAALQRSEDARLAMIAREAEWASRSPAARTTKQRARLDRLAALEAQRPLRREQAFDLDLRTGIKQGQTMIEATGLAKSHGRPLFDGLDISVLRGDRLGIIGPNGAGKSTLLGVLAGMQPADKGTLRLSPKVKVGLLDQHRTGLPRNATVFEAAGDGNDQIVVGERTVHVAGFLQRFLFPRSMHDQHVGALSGGERARLLMARLMLHGANLLLLDEPTNDLDLMTLRVLEEALEAFDGAALIVTHDRAFLDRVCTGVLAFEPDAKVVRYASREQAMRAEEARRNAPKAEAPKVQKPAAAKPAAQRRASYAERKEHEALPAKLEKLEAEVGRLEALLADPATWSGGKGVAVEADLRKVRAETDAAWTRWAELEELIG